MTNTPSTLSLQKLVDLVAIPYQTLHGTLDLEVKGLAWDPRQVKQGWIYFCLEEEEFQAKHIQENSLNHWQEAVSNGAVCLISNPDRIKNIPQDITLIEVEALNSYMAHFSRQFYENPLADMKIIGITGTNGKTTTSQLLDSILTHVKKQTGIIGTLGALYPSGKQETNSLSNPLATELFAIGQKMRSEKVDHLIMEVTSHGMVFDRTESIDFDVAVFTNLSQDHLDYHETFEAYKEAKLKHFERLGKMGKKPYAIINVDDSSGQDFQNAIDSKLKFTGKVKMLTFGIRNKDAELVGYPREMDGSHSKFDLVLRGDFLCTVDLPMPGLFNVYNGIAAFATAFALGVGIETIVEGIAQAKKIDGRFEKVETLAKFDIFIDYAHTPDSLEKILQEIKILTKKQVVLVFGCGGDRDRTKRPQMGRIACDLADTIIITSDNPRTESIENITKDILEGMTKEQQEKVIIEQDRKLAIHAALRIANFGDSVLIAGKGHETYQIIGEKTYPFFDRTVVQEFFDIPEGNIDRAWLEIDKGVIRRNLELINKDKPDSLKLLVVVKDNAMGHGVVEVADEAVQGGCDYLGVACLSEALELRKSGFLEVPILLFGERSEDEIPVCVQNNFSIQVQSLEKAELIAKESIQRGKKTKVHFKVDTGMGRYGVRWEEATSVFKQILKISGIEVEGIMTHFAQSDEAKKDFANLQWERFSSVLEELKKEDLIPKIVHASNTGAYLDLPHTQGNMVRIGTLVTGVYPSKVCRRIKVEGEELTPAMTAYTRVAFLKKLYPGDFVGYGMHYQAEKEMTVAVLPVGYGDGYPRLRNKGKVLIDEFEAPIIGGNAMDATMVDVSHLQNISIGSKVVLLGKNKTQEITAMMLADWAGTVTYDVLTRWTQRMIRIVIE